MLTVNVIKKILSLSLVLGLLSFGGVRLYFVLTDGFKVSNITSNFSCDSRWDTHQLTAEEKINIDNVLNQKFYYLGKGCQSYVFSSEDGQYVLKFFKYQRYRKSFWDRLAFIPWIKYYRQERWDHKKQKLEKLFTSWKIAFDYLADETQIVYVHLNKTKNLRRKITITDKLGFAHTVNLDDMEFMLQRKATMLCSTINGLVKEGRREDAKQLLHRTFDLILSEYQRGLADNDHALMQNTGVVDGQPIHVDIGQFIVSDEIKDPSQYYQHLVNKMYKFGLWLDRKHPELGEELHQKMQTILGEQYNFLTYQQPIQ